MQVSICEYSQQSTTKKEKKCELQMTNVHVKEELFLHKTKVIQADGRSSATKIPC